jgi:hypothetical protein
MIIVTTLFIIILFQSCGSSHKYQEVKAKNFLQAEEISRQRLQLEGNEQQLNALEGLVTSLQYENRRLESEIFQMSENVQEINNKYADYEWFKEHPLGAGIPLNSSPRPATGNSQVVVPDTVSTAVIGVNSGNLAFYCPRKVNYKEPFTALGFIADIISDQKVREQLLERVREVERDPDRVRLSDDNMLVRKIQFYKLIELRLDESSNSAFGIKKMHSEDKQEVSDKMEGWQWKVTPVASEKRQELFLKVIVYDEDGNQDFAFTKTYLFDVNVDPFLFVHNSVMLFSTNPEWAFGAVIPPLPLSSWDYISDGKSKKLGLPDGNKIIAFAFADRSDR